MNRSFFSRLSFAAVLFALVFAPTVSATAHLFVPESAVPYLTITEQGVMQLSVDAGSRQYVTDSFTQVHSSRAGGFKFTQPVYFTTDTVLIAEKTFDVYVYDSARAYPYVKVVDGNELTGSDPVKGLRFYLADTSFDFVIIKQFGASATPSVFADENEPRYCVNAYFTKQGEYCQFGCVEGFCRSDPSTLGGVPAATATPTQAPQPTTTLTEPPKPVLTVHLPLLPEATASLSVLLPHAGEWRTIDTPSGHVSAYFAVISSTRSDTFRGQAGSRTYYTDSALVQISDAMEVDAPSAGTVYLTRPDANGNPVTSATVSAESMTSTDTDFGLRVFPYEGKEGVQPFSQSVVLKAQPAAQSAPTSQATAAPNQVPAQAYVPTAMAEVFTQPLPPEVPAPKADALPALIVGALVLLSVLAWFLMRTPPAPTGK